MQSDSTRRSQRRYFLKHKDSLNAKRRQRFAASPERRSRKARQDRRYYAQNREAINERRREPSRKYAAEYREKNPEKVRAAMQKWRENHAEHERQYRQEHKDAARARKLRHVTNGGDKRYRAKNKARIAARKRQYYQEHRVEILAKLRRYYDDHPELFRAYGRNRRARMRSVAGTHTAADIAAIWKRQKGRCAVPGCKHPITEKGKDKYHVDHVRAIINGGSNGPENLQILCRHHNTAKQAKDEFQWAQENGLLFC